MSSAQPSEAEIATYTHDIVLAARRERALSSLTPRIVRSRIEEALGLPSGTLDAPEWKKVVKRATSDAVAEKVDDADRVQVEPEAEVKREEEDGSKKPVSKASANGEGSKKPLSKAKAPSSDAPKKRKPKSVQTVQSDEEDGAGSKKAASPAKKQPSDIAPKKRKRKSAQTVTSGHEDEEEEEKAPKKAKVRKPNGNVQAKEKKPRSKSKSKDKEFKSAEIIEDSDIDEDAEKPKPKLKPVPPAKAKASFVPKTPKAAASDVEDEDETITNETQLASPTKAKPPKTATSDIEVEDKSIKPSSSPAKSKPVKAAKSDSEDSVLIDEPAPKRKRKSADKESKKKGEPSAKRRTSKKSAEPLSKDEETIKRLKSFVVACGVRKVWSKELAGLDTPSAQISHLRRLLNDLGMTGRLSMEQARRIKEERELAKELEDVQQFGQAVAEGRPWQTRGKGAKAGEEDEEESGEESEGSVVPKRNAARMSIMAFLQDQSSDDE